jgi:8-oxo-dGTP pyrophosphatase MutT (NUDIX family)
MTKIEFSAGGIVFKKENNQTLILVARHSGHHGWVFPKGWIEKGESKEETALREVKEETGIEAKIIKPLTEVTYFYKLNDQRIKKTVSYFVMEYLSGDIKDHDWEMEEVIWLEKEKVLDKVTYATDKVVYQEALKYLN